MSPRHRGRQPAATPINNPLGTRGEVNQLGRQVEILTQQLAQIESSTHDEDDLEFENPFSGNRSVDDYTKEFLSICSKAYQPALAMGKQQVELDFNQQVHWKDLLLLELIKKCRMIEAKDIS